MHTEGVEGNVSNSSSQESSLPSQRSQIRAVNAAVSRQANAGINNDQITPSSSYSIYSTQENLVNGGSGSAHESRTPGYEGSTTGRVAPNDGNGTEQPGGHKRTATGQIKSHSCRSLPQSPTSATINGHSRESSIASRNSHIAEVRFLLLSSRPPLIILQMSTKLQARLSYAKVKLDHGWEYRSIGELERMTSAQASPVSATSYTARHTTPSAYSPVEHSLSAQAPQEVSTSVPREYHHPAPQNRSDAQHAGSILSSLTTSGNSAMLTSQPNETYEQFWESHSNVPASSRVSGAQSPNGRSLAPPVDFSPRNTASTKQRLPLSTNSRFPGMFPSTPPPRNSALATDRTSVEQDALEGLLSMNSPANSQNHSLVRPLLQSPLRAKAVEPSLILNGIVHGTSGSLTDSAQSTSALGNLHDDEFNKILDDMPDSSSDEDVAIKRRFPAKQLLRS